MVFCSCGAMCDRPSVDSPCDDPRVRNQLTGFESVPILRYRDVGDGKWRPSPPAHNGRPFVEALHHRRATDSPLFVTYIFSLVQKGTYLDEFGIYYATYRIGSDGGRLDLSPDARGWVLRWHYEPHAWYSYVPYVKRGRAVEIMFAVNKLSMSAETRTETRFYVVSIGTEADIQFPGEVLKIGESKLSKNDGVVISYEKETGLFTTQHGLAILREEADEGWYCATVVRKHDPPGVAVVFIRISDVVNFFWTRSLDVDTTRVREPSRYVSFRRSPPPEVKFVAAFLLGGVVYVHNGRIGVRWYFSKGSGGISVREEVVSDTALKDDEHLVLFAYARHDPPTDRMETIQSVVVTESGEQQRLKISQRVKPLEDEPSSGSVSQTAALGDRQLQVTYVLIHPDTVTFGRTGSLSRLRRIPGGKDHMLESLLFSRAGTVVHAPVLAGVETTIGNPTRTYELVPIGDAVYRSWSWGSRAKEVTSGSQEREQEDVSPKASQTKKYVAAQMFGLNGARGSV